MQMAGSERPPAVLERGITIVEFFFNVANKEPNRISVNPLQTMNLKCQVRSDGFREINDAFIASFCNICWPHSI